MFEVFSKAVKSLEMSAGSVVLVGVSGGPDSLALLHLFIRGRATLGLTPVAVYVDHGIRVEAAEDARFVQQTAEEWGVDCQVLKVNVPNLVAEKRLSLEEAARLARYRALAQAADAAGTTVIAVGHHADDQAETVLLNLIRGAGLAGLRGMQPITPLSAAHVGEKLPAGLMLVRPLLGISRAEIVAYCTEHGLTPRFDETNADTTLTRNRLRHDLLPKLAALNPNIRATLARTAAVLAGEYEIVQGAVEATWQEVMLVVDGQEVRFDRTRWRDQIIPMQRALIRRAVFHLVGSGVDLGFEAVEAAIAIAQRGDTGAQATLPGGIHLLVDYQVIHLTTVDAPSVRPDWPLLSAGATITFERPGVVDLADGWQFGLMPYEGPRVGADWQTLLVDRWQAVVEIQGRDFPVLLRTRQPGDTFYPMGAGGRQSLSDFFIDHKVLAAWRDQLPLLVVGGEIAWLAGWRVDARFAVRSDSGTAWHAFFRLKDTVD